MKLLVFGAAGGTGRELVTQALAQGHEVTAVVRSPPTAPVWNARVRVLVGSADDAGAVMNAVRGQDAVISALGARAFTSGKLISRCMQTIVPAMESQKVRRLILVSAFGVGDSRRDAPLLPWLFQRLLLTDIFADKKAGEDTVVHSGLEWTTVYPVALTNGPKTGKYRAGQKLPLRGFPTISRADVAHFALTQLSDTAFLKKVAVVSY